MRDSITVAAFSLFMLILLKAARDAALKVEWPGAIFLSVLTICLTTALIVYWTNTEPRKDDE